MEISGEHRFSAGRQAVWQALLDPKALQASMPAAKSSSKSATFPTTSHQGWDRGNQGHL